MSASHDVRRSTSTPAAGPQPSGGFRGWTARHPLGAFAVIVFPLGWAILGVPALMYHGVLPGGEVPVQFFALALTVLVMLPTAVWVVSVTEGRRGVRALFARTFRWRFPLGWWAFVLLGMPVASLAVGVALGRSLDTSDLGSVLVTSLLTGFLLPLVLVNLWEETVWAGFVQTRLEARHGLLGGALITAVGFAGIHIPMVFAADLSASTLLESFGFLVVAAVVFRLTAGVVMRGAAGSVLAVVVLHATWNASSGEDGVVDELLSGGQPVLIAVLALALITAAAMAVVRPPLGARPAAEVRPTGR